MDKFERKNLNSLRNSFYENFPQALKFYYKQQYCSSLKVNSDITANMEALKVIDKKHGLQKTKISVLVSLAIILVRVVTSFGKSIDFHFS